MAGPDGNPMGGQSPVEMDEKPVGGRTGGAVSTTRSRSRVDSECPAGRLAAVVITAERLRRKSAGSIQPPIQEVTR